MRAPKRETKLPTLHLQSIQYRAILKSLKMEHEVGIRLQSLLRLAHATQAVNGGVSQRNAVLGEEVTELVLQLDRAIPAMTAVTEVMERLEALVLTV